MRIEDDPLDNLCEVRSNQRAAWRLTPDHSMTQDRSFAVNRLSVTICLIGFLAIILIFAFICLTFAAAFAGLAMEFPQHLGESVMCFFAAVIFGGVLGIVCAYAGSLFKTLTVGGPALIVSSEGFKYCVASDDVIPWKEIKDVTFAGGFGTRKTAVMLRFQIESGFSDTLHWRSRIANSFKPETIAVRFLYIKAPKAEIQEALLRPLQSKPVQASCDLSSKADMLLGQ
ncbi:hypothetical protein [Bradyrhizobium acaciae]|uniref:hypothetical protein n=1 Tax=Bradyrhizobium acaciae TaxID=2683706 RepID=UPI001E510128|nr:hypothetical protein [Bradyrhizobium acaciae]MCC8979269.1 hypothetical protein [Bradyrhizobium acaciae]